MYVELIKGMKRVEVYRDMQTTLYLLIITSLVNVLFVSTNLSTYPPFEDQRWLIEVSDRKERLQRVIHDPLSRFHLGECSQQKGLVHAAQTHKRYNLLCISPHLHQNEIINTEEITTNEK